MEATEMFTPLADDYARYRPGYPVEVFDELVRACGLARDWVIADVGCGTGNLARLFLDAGYRVIGVEPVKEMREAGERLLADCPDFTSLEGSAENIPLDAHSVDMITVGQALHWFGVAQARAEFQRILRPGGWVAVTWNERQPDATEFMRAYKELTQSLVDIRPSDAATRSADTDLGCLFGSVAPHAAYFRHSQSFDLEGLLGRARSSGYIPQPEAPGHSEITARFTDLFARYQQSGRVEFPYVTPVYYGRLGDKQ